MQENKVRKMYIKPTFLLIVIFILLAILIGQIVAYFKDQESITNTFTIGNIEINLTEGEIWDAAYRNNTVPQIAQNLRPGDEVAKAPKAQNTGINPAYVYMKVYVPRYVNGDLFTYNINEADQETTGWIQREEVLHTDDGKYDIYLYEYSEELAAGSETTTLFDKVQLAGITPDEAAVIPQNQKIIIEAYAIQSENGISKASNEITTKMISKTGESISQKYTVTFDANGGTLPDYGNAETGTKDVVYGLEYGNLPVPTREGYKFLGWNGKSLFELKEIPDFVNANTSYNVNTEDKSVTIGGGGSWELIEYYLPELKANTTYAISGSVELVNSNRTYIRISKDRAKINNNHFILNMTVQNGEFNGTFTTGNEIESNLALALYGNWANETSSARVKISNLMIEEGTTATAYEPYHVTASTTVTQPQAHTLTAIWEPIQN